MVPDVLTCSVTRLNRKAFSEGGGGGCKEGAELSSAVGGKTKPGGLSLMSSCVALIKRAEQPLILNELLH